ncbi:XdhC family protein [Actinoplanes sp. TFC3]|uniref:XdhC family protein n=1 Tax=Actinoplanes sp. TFC3 TaxID=1710355 RepID=UPI0008353CFE|nr:XdhC family protein [Actinoplanes sp. TFC3]
MQAEQSPRHLIAVFASPVADALIRFAMDLGFTCTLVEPDPTRLQGSPRPHGDMLVSDLTAAGVNEHADIVLTDHHRAEIGTVLKDALGTSARWIGIIGNPNREAPHVPALQALDVPDDAIAQIHRPIGLNIGSKTPAEIAVATLAGLIADRNERPGGFAF